VSCGDPCVQYARYKRRRTILGIILAAGLLAAAIGSLCLGPADMSPGRVMQALLMQGEPLDGVIVWHIRLPRVMAAVLAGAALALAGSVMQCVLRNPLAAPFTMGVTQAAAFGAAFAIIVLGAGTASVVASAFCASLAGICIILILARYAGLSPQAIVLAGVALGTLFGAGTTLLQYFAEDVKVASVIFWTFGDMGRAGRIDVLTLLAVTIPGLAYIVSSRRAYNALEAGEETARALGVHTARVRYLGIFLASLMTAVVVAFVGIIGFVGLIAPHITRRLAGGDHRFLVPIAALLGATLLLVADTLARTVLSPVVLPVGIVTSFMGVPLFLYLIWKKRRLY